MPRKTKAGQLTWDDFDNYGQLRERQRSVVDLCVALLETEARGHRVPRLVMLDFVAAFTLYELFGGKPGEVEHAAVTHGNNIMELADRIDELCGG